MENKTSGKEFYFSVPGLMVPDTASSSTIIDSLNIFIEKAPELAEELSQNTAGGNAQACESNLAEVLELLKTIYAQKLEAEAEGISKELKSNFEEVATKRLPEFISNLRTLSIDIQTVQYEHSQSQGLIQYYSSEIQKLMAVLALTNNKEFEQALIVLDQIEVIKTFYNHTELRETLLHQKYDQAAVTINEMLDKIYQIIASMGGNIDKDGMLKKILAVDDRPEILNTVVPILKDVYQVYGATSGAMALNLIEKKTPDLFLFDIEMPGMDGYELLRRARLKPQFQKTPVIFLTSNCDRAYVLKAMRSGANDFIVKPINQGLLITKIAQILSAHV